LKLGQVLSADLYSHHQYAPPKVPRHMPQGPVSTADMCQPGSTPLHLSTRVRYQGKFLGCQNRGHWGLCWQWPSLQDALVDQDARSKHLHG
jgi:hypothetical protein